jgi:hypothetical protein
MEGPGDKRKEMPGEWKFDRIRQIDFWQATALTSLRSKVILGVNDSRLRAGMPIQHIKIIL